MALLNSTRLRRWTAWSLAMTRSRISVVGVSRASTAVRTLWLLQDSQYFCRNSGGVWALAAAMRNAANGQVLRMADPAAPRIPTRHSG